MISVDTNILFAGLEESHANHRHAASFLRSLDVRSDVALSEFALLELYVLVRNPVITVRPMTSSEAADLCQALRRHPGWQLLGFPPDSPGFHEALWSLLSRPGLARRSAYDSRFALSLRHHGVDEFATVNVKDFQGFGFARVWNPLAG